MKSVLDLRFGYADAENYRRRENRDLLNQLFIRTHHLDRLCDPSASFLIGEKGTGKTAYAVYLSNNEYHDTLATLRFIRETEYQKFVSMKHQKHLDLSDYASIWKVILYLLLSQAVQERGRGPGLLKRFSKLASVQRAVDEYYNKAFAPEISQALQFVQESEIAAKLLAKHAEVGARDKEVQQFTENRFQTNLFYIQRQFEEALSQIRIATHQILFIDGIDIRPESVPYEEYLACIKGLANAVWQVNNDFFPTIKGGGGRMRCVLLVRPDIFRSLSLQNQNTKIRDNSVFLDWRTEYRNYRTSELFRVVDHLMSSQQDNEYQHGACWDHYLPWDAQSLEDRYDARTSFISFLRFSYYRPRDILTMLCILQDISREHETDHTCFPHRLFNDPLFRRRYSDYLLGEIKDHLVFYYSDQDYELFLKFFTYLRGRKRFSYEEYIVAYEQFSSVVSAAGTEKPEFMSSATSFLQFLYDLNVLCYIEEPHGDKPYVRWCFRERSHADISPKVREGVVYEVFYGLAKALNVGQALR